MASPEVARFTRRLDEQDDTVRALSDTVLDIKETVDQHTVILAAIQDAQTAMQREQTTMQQTQTAMQREQTTMQQTQTAMQQTQAEHGELLAEILRRLGGSTAD